jgi:hypothetical protein
MTPLAYRVAARLAASPAEVPLLVGGCGSGRTSACLALRQREGPAQAQYVDLERVATTPESFLHALIAQSPFVTASRELPPPPDSPRTAFDEALRYLTTARTRDGAPAMFLVDEALELRTFESFPGLKHATGEFLQALDDSPNRFLLTTRYATRGQRAADAARARRLSVVPVEPLEQSAVRDALAERLAGRAGDEDLAPLARMVTALSAGRPLYVATIAQQVGEMAGHGVPDPISALAALLAPGGRLDTECRYRYEMRLQRARGYGALRAILSILAEEEPLSLTAIATRLRRTPGSTKDYLMWLGDVDLVRVERKRYGFADPLLRVWVRMHGRSLPPSPEDVAAEVQRFVLEGAPLDADRPAPAVTTAPRADRTWGIIEID